MEGVAVLAHLTFNRFRRTAPVVAAVILSATAIAFAPSTARAEESAWTLMPGGIANPSGTIGYVAGAGDSVEAIDMANGRPMWETKKGIRPLVLDGDRLVVEGPHNPSRPNIMKVVVLSAADGTVQLESEPIEFPDWIAVDGGIGLQFFSAADMEDGELIIRWQAVRQSIQPGPKVTAEVMAASRRNSTGFARVNLKDGKSSVLEDQILTPPKVARFVKFTDVGAKRLRVIEATEKVPGGITLLRRTIEASDKTTGRPMWQHEIAGDVILPDSPPVAMQQNGGQQQQQQQQRMQPQRGQQQPMQQSQQPRPMPRR
jgi:hypothetical protein